MKPERTVHGIVVGKMPFSNTSLLVTWATVEMGVIKTMAKGVSGPKPSGGLLPDLFYLCEIRYRPSEKGEIGALREARLLHPFLALRRDWNVLLCATYFADLLAALSEPGTEIAPLFDIFEQALRYLETHLPSARLVTRYEAKLLELSGLPSEADIPSALRRAVELHGHRVPASRAKVLLALGVS
ncbi:DNA repair protein RecO (recombination protein O) [Verrucomicrobium sp. GAS474]|uniref:DNA repair protein RecO n=1 Tax=Verrucomicrobium sp. GAS474 TaxID=1882831 RepID=UPI00087A992B|nr:DNA repair protein RecO [Verrucomicrobium sp. GAS474]SDU19992.1 DNA repair protein RecO (recombination protein O) [Verrucomicrobium sp. GAS474]